MPSAAEREEAARGIIGAEIDILVISGTNLVPKDGGGLFTKSKSSDPYVKVVFGGKELGRTPHVEKTLNPSWNHALKFMLEGKSFRTDGELVLAVVDYDKRSNDDPMGEVRLKISELLHGRVTEKAYPVQNCRGCKNASGELTFKVVVSLRRALSLEAHDSVAIQDRRVAIGLGWDPLPGNRPIDLDTSCVAINNRGEVVMTETVYFGKLYADSQVNDA